MFTGATSIGDSGLVYTTTGGGSGGNLPLYAFGGTPDVTMQRIILSDIFCNNISATGGGTVTLNGNTVIGDTSTDTLTVGASSTFNAIVEFTPGSANSVTINNGNVNAFSITTQSPSRIVGIIDNTGSVGTSGQVLSSTGSDIQWISNTAGSVTGTGTTNNLPVWSDGPNGVLDTSTISQVSNGNGNDVLISATGAADPLSVKFGTGGTVSFKTGTTEYARITSSQGGFYRDNFRYKGKLTVDRDSSSVNPSLDVGDSNHTYPAAWFRNGVVISNNPSGVTVDNTSVVIGSGNNDVVSGADNCLAVGNNNQILSDSDNSLAVGQGNIIRNNADNSFAIGQNNVIDGTAAAQSVKSQVLGFQNSLTGSFSSFIAGGQNTVTTNQNAVALGFSHTLAGDDSMFAFGENNTGPSGASDNNSFMIGGNLTGVDGNMVLGFRNDTSSYPTTDYSNGLGNTKFVVSVGTVTNSNAMIITEGGVTRGGGTTQVPRILMPTIVGFDYASDTEAASNGIPIGGIYHNNGQLYIRIT